MHKNNRILISGAGVAGLTAAYWLKKWGFEPIVIEKSPVLRKGGYMIDFWGLGFDVAEKMNILPQLEKAHYNIPTLDYVDADNNRKSGLSIAKMRKAVNYRHYNLLRGNLVKVIYDVVKPDVDIRFGRSVQSIENHVGNVDVTYADGSVESFDMLLGADGLHSNIRALAFGDETQYERYLGYYTSSFTIDNFLGKDNIFRAHNTPGKQIAIYSVADNKLAAFIVFKQEKKLDIAHHDEEGAKRILWNVFGDEGWANKDILERMEDAPDFYFDTVSQIVMDTWSKNRIALLGDASHCVSLLAGQGSALAMASAYILAGELKETNGDHHSAFDAHRRILAPEIARTRKIALDFAGELVPDSDFAIWKRNITSRLTRFQFVMNWYINRFMANSITLKDY